MTKEQLLKELHEMREQLRMLDSCKRDMQFVQTRYTKLLESAPDAMLFVNKDGRIITINAQLEHLFGYSEEELVGKDLHALIPERFRKRHRDDLSGYFSNPRVRPMGSGLQIFARRKDGTEFPADVSLSPLEMDGEMLAIASIRDITELRRSESRLERNYLVQTAISAVLKNSLEPISLDEQMHRALNLMLAIPGLSPQPRGSIYLVEDEPEVLVLRAFRSSPDLPPLCERIPFGKCICGEAAAECAVAFTECIDERHEIRYSGERPHGHYCVPIVSSGQSLGLINIFTEEGHERTQEEETFLVAVSNTLATVIMRHQAESELDDFRVQLSEAEKFAALGRMTANVAHEIRNPLTAIGGFAKRLEKRVREGPKEKQYAAFIVEEVQRLEGILRNVLSFSRGASPRLREGNLREIVEEAVKIFEETCRDRSITIRSSFRDIPPVLCDRERVLEAIENLVSNAVDAMPQGGLLLMTVEEESIKGAPYVTVKVSDTGEGIKEGDMKRIFEPFFTTKQSPKGVGLGLPIVKRFVEDHGGMVHVESKVGEGTTFTLYFPQTAG